MREIEIEKALVREVKQRGGLCWKFVSPGNNGVPDRIVLLPNGRIAFVETKAPGKKPKPLQLVRHETLRKLGFSVYVIDRMEQITKVIQELTNSNHSHGGDET